MPEPFVFLGIPCYDGVEPTALDGMSGATSKARWYRKISMSSAITQNFNDLWCICLNNRHQGFTHFAMQHSDIEAPMDWIDVLLEEKERVGADVLSVVSPIKDRRGLTSCGTRDPETGFIRRLTMHEVMKLPETFGIEDIPFGQDQQLVVNTGLWICSLDSWVDDFPGFVTLTEIQTVNGQKRAAMLTEDWNFSRWLAEMGLKAMLTRKVPIQHWGKACFDNSSAWGTWKKDMGDGHPLHPVSKPDEEEIAAPIVAQEVDVAKKEVGKIQTCEIVAVRYAEDMAWVHGWLDDLLVQHGPGLTYRIYDKGPGGNLKNIGNLDWTYLYHIVNRWDELADWTIFTQADPFPHMKHTDGTPIDFYESLIKPSRDFTEIMGAAYPFLVRCREWGEDGRLHWHKFPDHWKRQYENGTIHPAKLSLRDWFQEYIGIDIDRLGYLTYMPGAIFGVGRDMIHSRPKAFYERLLANLGEGEHRCPEEAHYMERAWPYVFRKESH